MKRFRRVLALTIVMLFIMSTSVLAAIPSKTVITSTGKAYALGIVDTNADAQMSILDAIKNGEVYVKLTDDAIVDLDGNPVDKSVIPEVVYTDGNVTERYAKGDGEKIIDEDNELKVESVSAINANEIQVTFSAPVDATSAKTTDNYVITLNNKRYGKDNANNPYNGGLASVALDTANPVTVSKDGKVVTLKLKNTLKLDNGDKYGVDVRDGIYSADMSKRVEKYGDTQKVFQDYNAPKLLKVALDADNKLVLTFDEPIFDDSAAEYPDNEKFKVTVDGTPVAMAAPSTTPLVYTVTSKDALPADALEKGVHNVVVYNARDLVENNGAGGNKAAILRGFYEIAESVDEEPFVEAIIPIDFNSFYVVFSEAVTNAKVIVTKGTTEFYNNTEDSSSVAKIGNAALVHLPVTASSAKGGITPLYAKDAMSTNIAITVKDYKAKASDLLGKQYSGTLTLERDDLLPKAAGDAYNSIDASGHLNVALNRKVDNLDNTKITVLDKDGISRVVDTTSTKLSTTNDVVEIVLKKDSSNPIDGEGLKKLAPFTVSFAPGALKVDTDKVDVPSDKLAYGDGGYEIGDFTNSLKNIAHSTKVIDKKADEHAYKAVEAVKSVTVENNVITITYKEEMAVSATQIANYTLDGEAMPAGTKIAMDGENKVVTITLPEGTFAKNVQKKLVISKKVMTKAGSYVVGNLSTKEEYMSDLLPFKDNTKPVLEKAQFVVSDTSDTTIKTTNTIRLTFDENIAAALADAAKDNFVIIAHDGTEIAVTNTTATDGTGKVVDLTLASDVNMSQVVKVKVVPESESGKAQALTDLEGNTLAEGIIVTVSGKVQ